MPDYLWAMPRMHIIAHRGASGYEYENSRAAFRRAVMLDADGVELDVHATQDGALVVHHDADLPGVGPIATLTRAEVRQIRIRNGETLPLLEEVLDLLGEHIQRLGRVIRPKQTEAVLYELVTRYTSEVGSARKRRKTSDGGRTTKDKAA